MLSRQYAAGDIKRNPNPDTERSYFGNYNMYHIMSETLDGKPLDENND